MLRSTLVRIGRDYTLLSAEGMFRDVNEPWLGRNLWEAHPDARRELEPICRKAWHAGYCYKVVPYRGCAVAVHANTVGDVLVVQFTTLPLDGLQETIEALLYGAPESAPPSPTDGQVIPFRRRSAAG